MAKFYNIPSELEAKYTESKLRLEAKPMLLSNLTMVDLIRISIICNRVYRQDVSPRHPGQPLLRIQGLEKVLKNLVGEIGEELEAAKRNMNSKKFSTDAVREQVETCNGILLRILYLTVENLSAISNWLDPTPHYLPSLIKTGLDASSAEAGLKFSDRENNSGEGTEGA